MADTNKISDFVIMLEVKLIGNVICDVIIFVYDLSSKILSHDQVEGILMRPNIACISILLIIRNIVLMSCKRWKTTLNWVSEAIFSKGFEVNFDFWISFFTLSLRSSLFEQESTVIGSTKIRNQFVGRFFKS